MTRSPHRILPAAAVALTFLIYRDASAEVHLYTHQAAFLAAVQATQTVDFDALASGTVLADGSSVDWLTFHYDFGGVQLRVTDAFDSTTAPNSLGTDDGDVLQGGDDLTLTFMPTTAFGLMLISPDELLDGDAALTVGTATASLVAADVQQAFPDGGAAYFLGIVDTSSTFNAATLTTLDGGYFLFNIDDIIAAEHSYEPTDFNQDGVVDGADLQKWEMDFGTALSDADDDGDSDGNDLLLWQRQVMGGGFASSIPEPRFLYLIAVIISLIAKRLSSS